MGRPHVCRTATAVCRLGSMRPGWSTLSPILTAIVPVILGGCSGNASLGGFGGGEPVLLDITAQGVSTGLWHAGAAPPVCPVGIFANGEITFTFAGLVAP